jgi:hypothetical protein
MVKVCDRGIVKLEFLEIMEKYHQPAGAFPQVTLPVIEIMVIDDVWEHVRKHWLELVSRPA